MKKIYAEYILIFVAAVLGIGVQTLFKGCGAMEDGSYMHCHTAQLYVFVLSLGLVIINIGNIFLNGIVARRIISFVSVILSLIVTVTPGILVPLCMMETMRCNAIFKPFVYVLGAILVVISVVNAVALIKSRGVEDEENLSKAFN